MTVQLRVLAEVDDFLDEPLAFIIPGMRLTGKNKLHRLP